MITTRAQSSTTLSCKNYAIACSVVYGVGGTLKSSAITYSTMTEQAWLGLHHIIIPS